MINFIISDNYEVAVKTKTTIDSYMMKYDIEVKYHLLTDFNKEFKEKAKNISSFKIYFLDNTKLKGFEQAKYIREELDDWNSLIVLLKSNEEQKYEYLENKLFLFDIINKNRFFEKELKDALEKMIKHYNNRENCLTIESNRIIKIIDFKSIDMIIKEKDSKKCIIKATYGNFYTPESLNQVSKRLDNRFVKINRSCIINGDKIEEYNLSENKITLTSGIVSYDISRDYKKKVSSYFVNYK